MPITPETIRDDLRGVFRGRLHFDPATRGLYSTDASPFQVQPLGVAVPLDEADLAALVKYAHAAGVPLVPRGAGTGLAGESLGPGLVIDLSVHFRGEPEIGPDWVRAAAGVTLAELDAVLAPRGRRFAPDPASAATATVGGAVGTNASGATAYRHGYTRDHVRALRVVWDDGETSDVRCPLSVALTTDNGQRTTDTARLLTENRALIESTRPRTPFDRCGYLLHDVLTPAGPDLAKLLTGTEGTLGVVTGATLATIPRPGGAGGFVLGFAAFDDALLAGLALRRADGVAGCDILDQRLLSLVRGVPAGVGAAVVAMLEADTERAAVAAGSAAIELLRGGPRFVELFEPAADPAGVERIDAFRRAAVGGLYALGRGRRPEAFVEDVGVPAEELPAFVARVREVLQHHDLTASVLAHALTGQVHVRPLVDLADPADREKLWPVAEEIHRLALAVGGTVSAQHGTGIARTPWVEKQAGPLMPVYRELKRVFDPKGILNPGKIVGPDPSRPAWPLRTPAPAVERVSLLAWGDGGPAAEAAKCNGCGDCRTRTPPARMCPVFHATGVEAAAPRGKANLLREVLSADPAALASGAVREVADLCVGCQMCRSECRAGVDVPGLMLEAKAAHHAAHGLDRGDWFFARVEGLSALAGTFAFTANALLGSRVSRWAMEKLFGLSRARGLPRFTHRTFLRRAKRAGLTAPPAAGAGPKVAYFADTYANLCDPLIGEAAVAVLRYHGYAVHVPPGQRGSGMAALAHGDLDSAREAAAANVRALAGPVRDGHTVVCTEPTAALALTREYPRLLDDPDAELVAANTVELTTFLGDLRDRGELRHGFRELPVGIGHHVPCHLKALGRPAAGPGLLGLIPGARVHSIDVGCSGMAGTWGLRAANRANSFAAGKAMLAELDRPRVEVGSTECGSCRLQMQDGTGKRTLHPVQILALAYGLMPELEAKLLRKPRPRLTD